MCKKQNVPDEQIKIIASINPYYLLLKQIIQDNARIDLLIPPNSNPHNYAPKPDAIKNLENADIIIANGLELEIFLTKKLSTIEEKVIYAADFLDNTQILSYNSEEENEQKHEEHEHDEHDDDHHHEDHNNETRHQHGDYDPHIWLNPQNLIIIAKGITARLVELDSKNQDLYNDNLSIFIDEIKKMDQKIIDERAALQKINIITYHDAFSYFFKQYNILKAGVISASPGVEATPAELVKIGNIIKDFQVKAIFIEPQLNPKGAEILAREFNLKLLTLDPLGFHFKAQKPRDLIEENWEIIKKSLE